jgi:alpha-beta hydrolase superfamily lysophospholipase
MSDAAWATLGNEGLWRPATRSRAPALPRLRTTAATDAKPASGDAPRPVVLLTPGFTWPAASVTVLAADLASNGYIVFTIDPPPGTEPVGSGDATMVGRWAARLAAIHATLKLVGEPALAEQVGSMDTDRVAVGGHSYGGIVAFDASHNESGVAAVFDLDGVLGYAPGARPVSVPALVIKSELGFPWQIRLDPVELALLRGSGQLTTVGIRGAGHCDLGDAPIVYLAADTKPEPELAWCYGTIGPAADLSRPDRPPLSSIRRWAHRPHCPGRPT